MRAQTGTTNGVSDQLLPQPVVRHELTIAIGAGTHTTAHTGLCAAFRALLSHAIAADLYLQSTRRAPAGTTFALIHLDEAARESRVIGTATITVAVSGHSAVGANAS